MGSLAIQGWVCTVHLLHAVEPLLPLSCNLAALRRTSSGTCRPAMSFYCRLALGGCASVCLADERFGPQAKQEVESLDQPAGGVCQCAHAVGQEGQARPTPLPASTFHHLEPRAPVQSKYLLLKGLRGGQGR